MNKNNTPSINQLDQETNIDSIIRWIDSLNSGLKVSLRKISLKESDFWFYSEKSGQISNRNNSFFRITGLQKIIDDKVILEQPIIIQKEIGYLGIICKEFDGVMHFLMQAKIEPGNINKVQISPTIQATKSNFTQKHGGKKPAYLDYFINASKYKIIVDQIQSEQSSRFFGKRNRNIIIEVNEEIEVLPSHRWMTLKQIKTLMRYDNLVNMDTRTVLSCIPINQMERMGEITDNSLIKSMFNNEPTNIPEMYSYINDCKMFDEGTYKFVPLHELKSWDMKDDEIVCKHPYSFKVIYCDIEIEGREVKKWTQPLFEATGKATFGLMTCIDNGVRKFLVQALPEVGCFDTIEIAPSIQREYIYNKGKNCVDALFDEKIKKGTDLKFDTLLSEEGGRFYCEQNRNLIVEIDKSELPKLPDGYFWTDYKTLNQLIQVNNCLNIQLRNLLSVLEW